MRPMIRNPPTLGQVDQVDVVWRPNNQESPVDEAEREKLQQLQEDGFDTRVMGALIHP